MILHNMTHLQYKTPFQNFAKSNIKLFRCEYVGIMAENKGYMSFLVSYS